MIALPGHGDLAVLHAYRPAVQGELEPFWHLHQETTGRLGGSVESLNTREYLPG